jgi:hypothetical protein
MLTQQSQDLPGGLSPFPNWAILLMQQVRKFRFQKIDPLQSTR